MTRSVAIYAFAFALTVACCWLVNEWMDAALDATFAGVR